MVNTSTKPYKWKEYRKYIDDRGDCDSSCKYYHYCPLTTPEEGQMCRLKNANDEHKRRFFNLFVRGEKGLRDEFFETVYRIGCAIDFETDLKMGSAYIEMLQKAKRMYYDKTEKQSTNDKVEIKVNNTAGFKESIPITLEQQREDEDPDSLFNSPFVDAIVDADVRD